MSGTGLFGSKLSVLRKLSMHSTTAMLVGFLMGQLGSLLLVALFLLSEGRLKLRRSQQVVLPLQRNPLTQSPQSDASKAIEDSSWVRQPNLLEQVNKVLDEKTGMDFKQDHLDTLIKKNLK